MKADQTPVVCVTAYDFTSGAIADSAGVDVILVGDSVGNVVLGFDTTVPVTLDTMVHHTAATARGVKRALLVADLPFGSYQTSPEDAVRSAVALARVGAEAVKLEGDYDEACTAIVRSGLPVMAHVGFTPQSVNQFGGFRVQGRGDEGERVLEQAKLMENAGAFAIVLELVPAELAARISETLTIPTIGIGAGPHCDGQIQVFHDLVGLAPKVYRHAKKYANGRSSFVKGIRTYSSDVRSKTFPTEDQSF